MADDDNNLLKVDTETSFSEEPEIRLKEGIDIQALRLGDGTEFQVEEPSRNDFFASGDYNHDEVYRHGSALALGEDNSDSDVDDYAQPFEKLARQMELVTQDGGVRKRVLRHGEGERVPKECFVTIHYNGYLEYADEPFDSTRLRGKPRQFMLGSGEVLSGLDEAVVTMRKNELSRFVLTPEYGFGKHGVPPRIPPASTLMFEVELLKFVKCAGVDEYYSKPVSERKNVPFELLKKVVLKEREDAKDKFAEKKYDQASRCYNKAIRSLEDASLKDEKDEIESRKLLLEMYLNMAVCCLQMKQDSRVIHFCNLAFHEQEDHPKALYLKGKALMKLGQFDQARHWLLRARKVAPSNKDISKALEKLNQDEQKFKLAQKDFCGKMFKTSKSPDSAKKKNVEKTETKSEKTESSIKEACSLEFAELVHNKLKRFLDNPKLTVMPFPSGNFTVPELACIGETAKNLGLTVLDRQEDGQMIIQIKKPSE